MDNDDDAMRYMATLDPLGKGIFEAALSDPERKASIHGDLSRWRLAAAAAALAAMGEAEPEAADSAMEAVERRLPSSEECALECMASLTQWRWGLPGSDKLEACRGDYGNRMAKMLAAIEKEILGRNVQAGIPRRGPLVDL